MTDYRLKVIGTFDNSIPWSFRVHASGAVTEAQAAAAAQTAMTNMWAAGTPTPLNAWFAAGTKVTEVIAYTLNATMKQTTGTPLPLALVGTDAAQSLPWDRSPIISLRTANLTRSGRGRIFLPASGVDTVNGHRLGAGFQGSLEAGALAFFAAIKAANLTPFLYNAHQLKDGTPPFTHTTITHIDIPDKFSDQSRRSRKIVPNRIGGNI